MLGASAIAMATMPQIAFAQDADDAAEDDNVILVTGIRASLEAAADIKREAQGVVDAISAEDIGKFPDTNLAESLQRITGVSIDRSNGEGSNVTVRGFGPEFNLVLLNGRQMPASGLGNGTEAPVSRSFDFANLASEGIAGVEVYKSGRASLPTGGIGSVINIKTPRPLDRPGARGSVGAKAVMDHTFEGTKITPEISGIYSTTFADDTMGVMVSGSYQRRKASLAQFNAGWREGYLGDENNWGSLGYGDNVENRPDATDIYQVTQNAGYDFTDIDRERFNGQAVFQIRPTDNLTGTLDYTFSQNTIEARTNSIGVWFNHENTSSSWTDGPAAGPNFYSETFGPNKDLAITGAVAANRSINHSLGGNLEWEGPGGLSLVLDAHHSTATSKPTSPYGSNIAVGAAIYGVEAQTVDFTTDMPVISVDMFPGSEIDASNIRPAGNAFRNAYMRDRINEVALKGHYDFDASFIESLDFGATYTDNKVRSAYGFIQNETWSGTLPADETPDDLFDMTDLSDDLAGMEGSDDPAIIPNYFKVDTVGLINLLDDELGICANTGAGAGTCLADYTIDRRIREKTFAPYIQSLHTFDLLADKAHLRLGLRYEKTKINSSALVPVAVSTAWTGANEIAINYSGGTTETRKGSYDNWLPAIDFDMSPIQDVKLRASYSHTITRPNYGQLQGGIALAAPIRPDGGSTASVGNPGLLPYKSKNIDLSAEWYYAPASYASVGYFRKKVSDFPVTLISEGPQYGLTNPAQGLGGELIDEAIANLPADSTFGDQLAYIAANYPEVIDPVTGGILGQPDDPLVNFRLSTPFNGDRTATIDGWEFAVQHNLWDTGFGVILNYTIVDSDTYYDNTLRYTATQFAITGVSDSANAVLFYDKGPLQARVAYNWRDGFLANYGSDPFYVESYGQWDASASYEFMEGLTAFVEGINITNADRRGHMRNDQTTYFAAPGYARYATGVRYTF
ncbi:TonB-dependent receptor [Croceicoccus naphthovorans]|nr:TonB-dependent receptor [Croceicoccus naphthovorans]